MEFQAFFEEHIQRVVVDLVEKYNMIGDQYLKSIEESIFETSTKCHRNMKEYYYFWERRVYNAIVKMVLRALLSFKNLIDPPNKKNIPLFYVKAEYNHPEVSYQPQRTEAQMQLQQIQNSIMQASQLFWRWKDGYCTFCDLVKG